MKKKTKIFGLGSVLLGVFALVMLWMMHNVKLDEIAAVPVQEGPFRVTLCANGELKSLRSRVITSEISGLTITKIIPEGMIVELGDTLIWFDRTELERQWRSRRNQLDTQMSNLAKQKERISLASFQKEMAVKRAAVQLEYTQAELAEAQAKLSRQRELFHNKLTSLSEVEAARLNLRQAEIRVESAVTDSTKAANDLTSGIKIQEAELKQTEVAVEQARDELEEVEKDFEETIIRAPYSGMIMYFEDPRPESGGKPRVGTQVRKGQKLLEVPDLREMIVEITIRERDISLVRPNQKAQITLDAFPELSLCGAVFKIATLAEEVGKTTAFFGAAKGSEGTSVFTVTILIDKNDLAVKQAVIAKVSQMADSLADRESTASFAVTTTLDSIGTGPRPNQIIPGMTASVEILVDALDWALYVPLEAVIYKDAQSVLYVMLNGKFEKRGVTFGIWNANNIVVRRGAKVGELVCLRDPTVKLEAPEIAGAESRARSGAIVGP